MNQQSRAITKALPLLVLGAAAACGVPADPPFAHPSAARITVQRLAGCWHFESRSVQVPYLRGQLTVRLDTVPRAYSPDLLAAAVDTPLASRVRIAYWAVPVDSSKLVVSWGDGFTGLHLQLKRRGDTLTGRAYRFTDVVPFMRSSIRVVARPVNCPSTLELAPNPRLQRAGQGG